jgi:hypothetical protein
MRSVLVIGGSSESEARLHRDRIALAARRRAYNREYMRAWRSDPRHQARERVTRERAYYERKLRDALRERRPFTNDAGMPVCGLCGKLPPVAEILRLRICDHARGGYVPIRLPYCGQC